MNTRLQVVLIIGVLLLMGLVIVLVKSKRINLKYSLLWFFSGLVTLVVCFFPTLAIFFSRLIGIQSVENFIFLVVGVFNIFLLIYLTTVVSKQTNQIFNLVQENALLDEEIRKIQSFEEDRLKNSKVSIRKE